MSEAIGEIIFSIVEKQLDPRYDSLFELLNETDFLFELVSSSPKTTSADIDVNIEDTPDQDELESELEINDDEDPDFEEVVIRYIVDRFNLKTEIFEPIKPNPERKKYPYKSSKQELRKRVEKTIKRNKLEKHIIRQLEQ